MRISAFISYLYDYNGDVTFSYFIYKEMEAQIKFKVT